jgi:hypothetical protein
VRFSTITLRVASQRVFIVAVYFVIDSVQKLLCTPSYVQDVVVYEGVSKTFWTGRLE